MADLMKTELKQVTASRQTDIAPALSDDLVVRVLTPENLRKAWPQVKINHGAPGVERRTIEDFPVFARDHWPSIRQALRDETDLGLVSIRTLCILLHYPPGTAQCGLAC